jgi:translation initiation factor IF-3
MQNNQTRIRVNNYIRVPQVRVIQSDGTLVGVMDTFEAIKMAKELSLDLVEINPKAVPPVCKLIDFGKFKYEEKKRIAEQKKGQKTQELKEITFRPNTDENDLHHKVALAKDFLKEGHRVKFTIRFRGREITHPQVGRDKMTWILQELTGLIIAAPPISLDGKFMSMLVAPTK